MKTYKVNGTMNPVIFSLNGKTYACAGKNWLEVPEGTKLSQIVNEKKKTKVSISKNNSWKVKGSKGNIYTVTVNKNNYNCNCVGFSFRRKCKHVEQIKKEKI